MPTSSGAEGAIRSPNTYGTQDTITYTIGALAFEPVNSGTTFAYGGSGSRYLTAGSFWEGPVNLPAGALVSAIELQACDNDPAGSLTATLYSGGTSGGVLTEINHGSVTAADGTCQFTGANLPATVTIDNFFRTYFIQVFQNGSVTGLLKFQAVRMYYKLQVSPAPATARFTDVPTSHPFFQYIEALAASGVTTGCTATQYCPDAPITRGQMAVFLARALGLHWPL